MTNKKLLRKALSKTVAYERFSDLIEFGCTDERIKIWLNEIAPKVFGYVEVPRHANVAEKVQGEHAGMILKVMHRALSEVIEDFNNNLVRVIFGWSYSRLYKVANAFKQGRKLKEITETFYEDFIDRLANDPYIWLRREVIEGKK